VLIARDGATTLIESVSNPDVIRNWLDGRAR
jgi:hypothetical protein